MENVFCDFSISRYEAVGFVQSTAMELSVPACWTGRNSSAVLDSSIIENPFAILFLEEIAPLLRFLSCVDRYEAVIKVWCCNKFPFHVIFYDSELNPLTDQNALERYHRWE